MKLFSALAATTMIAAAPALAQTPTGIESVSRVISYAGLDLASSAGQTLLDQRIGHAVRDLCGPIEPGNLAQQMTVRKCRKAAFESAAPQRRTAIARAGGAAVDVAIRTGR